MIKYLHYIKASFASFSVVVVTGITVALFYQINALSLLEEQRQLYLLVSQTDISQPLSEEPSLYNVIDSGFTEGLARTENTIALTEFFLALTLVGLGVLWRFLHLWDKNTQRLFRGLEKSANGDFETRLELHDTGLSESVTSAFNRTMIRICDTMSELEDAKKEAEASSKAKTLFFTNMSHELRTPMHSILSFSKVGKKKIKQNEYQNLSKYFEIIHGSGQRLLKTLDDILDLAKIEAGKMDFSMRESNLYTPLKRVCEELGPLFSEKGITLDISSANETSDAFCDELRMEQVFRNVIYNALKFSPAGSTVHVAVDQHVSPSGEEQIIVSVADQGPGIDEDKKDAIFDTFIQAKNTTQKGEGTGLGLAICKEIILAHGGEITVKNNVIGAGCTFSICLPKEHHAIIAFDGGASERHERLS